MIPLMSPTYRFAISELFNSSFVFCWWVTIKSDCTSAYNIIGDSIDDSFVLKTMLG